MYTEMYRPFRQRGGRKTLTFVLTGSLLLLYYLCTSSYSETPLESTLLDRYMNHDPENQSPQPASAGSSVEWGDVAFEYPREEEIAPLPANPVAPLPRIQYQFKPESRTRREWREGRRQEVKKLFGKNWQSYRKLAWMKDALLPVSGGSKDQFSGWAATLVDCLDTLWIMGLRDEFNEAVAAVARIDFGTSTGRFVNTFETNIRYLGGLLSAYDLSRRPVLLDKAVELGNLIYLAFNTPNGMPVDFIDFERAKTGAGLTVEDNVVSASPGTLSLEMTRLSQLTGDPKYFSAASRVMALFHDHQNETLIPGLWPMFVSMRRQDVVSGSSFTLGGCADSLYEYLPKMHALLAGRDPRYEAMTRAFTSAADATLFFRPMLPGGENVLVSGNANVAPDGHGGHVAVLDPESEHLACFVGGTFALAGRLLRRPGDVETGARLTRGCIYAYRAMPTGMMPERFNMAPCAERAKCPWSEGTWAREKGRRPEWKEHLPRGFTTAKDPRYILRPEAIESVFVLYRITGLDEFREAAWDMFTAIRNGTATEYANAAVLDVTKAEYPLPQEDYMEVRLFSFPIISLLFFSFFFPSTPQLGTHGYK